MIKMTFGLQPKHLEIIEERLNHWNKPFEFKGETVVNKMQYSKEFWEDCGRRIGWEPFTLALYYFRKQNKETI